MLSSKKERKRMALLQWWDRLTSLSAIPNHAQSMMRERTRRRQLVSAVLLVVACFQLVDLPGAVIQKSLVALLIVVVGLAVCGGALLFNRGGRAMVSSILLLIVIDLGFALMLLLSPHGLVVGDLPLFDGLIVSELIAVSLLPAVSVFPVALGNILFILAFLTLEPPSPALREMLASGMAYDVLARPICLQIIVAVVAYL